MNEGANPYEAQGNPAPSGGYGGGNNGGYNRNNNSGGNSGGYNRGGGGYNRGGNGGSSGGYNRSGGGGGYPNRGGGGFSSGGKPAFQKKEYTPEELKALKIGISCVITGNENFNDQTALMVGRIVKAMESKNVVVRTGGLNGIDQVVMDNAREAELHIPFRNFNKLEAASQYSNEPCLELARRYLPELDTLPNVPKATFAKNPRLVMGRYLSTPAQLVIVWSEDGCERPHETTPRSGMAGHVVKIAAAAGIRVINLQRPDAEARAMKFVESIYVQQEPKPVQPPEAATGPSYGTNPGTVSPGPGPASYQQPGTEPGSQPAGPSYGAAPTGQPVGQPVGHGSYQQPTAASYDY